MTLIESGAFCFARLFDGCWIIWALFAGALGYRDQARLMALCGTDPPFDFAQGRLCPPVLILNLGLLFKAQDQLQDQRSKATDKSIRPTRARKTSRAAKDAPREDRRDDPRTVAWRLGPCSERAGLAASVPLRRTAEIRRSFSDSPSRRPSALSARRQSSCGPLTTICAGAGQRGPECSIVCGPSALFAPG
jgi:hypothetical protein